MAAFVAARWWIEHHSSWSPGDGHGVRTIIASSGGPCGGFTSATPSPCRCTGTTTAARCYDDYGWVTDYLAPRNPHPDSILFRSTLRGAQPQGRDPARRRPGIGGRRALHYHQFLKAGENTLNIKLCGLLIESLNQNGGYDADDYLRRYIAFMTTPGNHRDTYIEECHRNFFGNYAKGVPPRRCGAVEKHIGGLVGIVPILVFYSGHPDKARAAALEHLALTHPGEKMASRREPGRGSAARCSGRSTPRRGDPPPESSAEISVRGPPVRETAGRPGRLGDRSAVQHGLLRGALGAGGALPGVEIPQRPGEGAGRQHQPGGRQRLPRGRCWGPFWARETDWKNSRSVGSKACSNRRRSCPCLLIEPIAE
ncbi:MAG: ADP-ribosylglycohydrolase family protein [Desulfomicrobium escambiense]|nr:ADP-ribosylglycohydrolase family protein [Desulfomicrobium escambiense]